MGFSIFGFNETSSIFILLAIILGTALLIGVVIMAICCSRGRKGNVAKGKGAKLVVKGMDSLIPPIYFTGDIGDPLAQADLKEKL
jgi:hypothetical protein